MIQPVTIPYTTLKQATVVSNKQSPTATPWKYSRSKYLFAPRSKTLKLKERERKKKREGKLMKWKIRQHKHEIGAFPFSATHHIMEL